MNAWILIMTLMTSHGSAMTTHEFWDQSACEAAKTQWLATIPQGSFVFRTAICVEK